MHFKSRTSSYHKIVSFLIIFLFTFNSIVLAAPLDTSTLRAISAKQSAVVPQGLQEKLQATPENKTSSSGEQKLTVLQKLMGKNPAVEAQIRAKLSDGSSLTITKENIADAKRFLASPAGDFSLYEWKRGKESLVEVLPPRKSDRTSSKTSSAGNVTTRDQFIEKLADSIAEAVIADNADVGDFNSYYSTRFMGNVSGNRLEGYQQSLNSMVEQTYADIRREHPDIVLRLSETEDDDAAENQVLLVACDKALKKLLALNIDEASTGGPEKTSSAGARIKEIKRALARLNLEADLALSEKRNKDFDTITGEYSGLVLELNELIAGSLSEIAKRISELEQKMKRLAAFAIKVDGTPSFEAGMTISNQVEQHSYFRAFNEWQAIRPLYKPDKASKTSSAGWDDVYKQAHDRNEALRNELSAYTAAIMSTPEYVQKITARRESLEALKNDNERNGTLSRYHALLRKDIVTKFFTSFGWKEFFTRLSEVSGVPEWALKGEISHGTGETYNIFQVTSLLDKVLLATNRLKVKIDLLSALSRHMKDNGIEKVSERGAIRIDDRQIPYRGHILSSLLDNKGKHLQAIEHAIGYKIRLRSQYVEEEDGPASDMRLFLSNPVDMLTVHKIFFNSFNPSVHDDIKNISAERVGKNGDLKASYKYPVFAEIFDRPVVVEESKKTSSAGEEKLFEWMGDTQSEADAIKAATQMEEAVGAAKSGLQQLAERSDAAIESKTSSAGFQVADLPVFDVDFNVGVLETKVSGFNDQLKKIIRLLRTENMSVSDINHVINIGQIGTFTPSLVYIGDNGTRPVYMVFIRAAGVLIPIILVIDIGNITLAGVATLSDFHINEIIHRKVFADSIQSPLWAEALFLAGRQSLADTSAGVVVKISPRNNPDEGYIFKINIPGGLSKITFHADSAEKLAEVLNSNFTLQDGYHFQFSPLRRDQLNIEREFLSGAKESVVLSLFNISDMERLLAQILRKDQHGSAVKTSSSGIDFSSMDDYDAEALLTKHLLDYSPEDEIAVDVSQQAIIVYSDVLKNSPALQDAIKAGNGDSRLYYLVNKEGVPVEEFLDGIGLAKSWFENYIFDAEGKSSVNIVDAITVVLQRNNIKQARVFAQAEEDLKAWSAQDVIETLIMLLKDKVFEIISDYADQHEDYIRVQGDILSAA